MNEPETNWSTGPWTVEVSNTFEASGKNWTVCNLGRSSEDDKFYQVTTDHVRASEYSGDAKWDAHLISAAPELYLAVLHLSDHQLSFGCIGCKRAMDALKKARGDK